MEAILAELSQFANPRPPAEPEALVSVVLRFPGRLPEEVRRFYSMADGIEHETDPDHGWTHLWQLSAWVSIRERVSPDLYGALGDLPLIADYCQESWWFALDVRTSTSDFGSVYLVDGRRPAKRVASSFAGFVAAVIRDDDAIYPADDPELGT